MSSSGGPSCVFPSDSDEDEGNTLPPSPDYAAELAKLDEDQELCLKLYHSNATMMAYLLDHQDEEEPKHGGSIVGHEVIDRKRLVGGRKLYEDYFSDNPGFKDKYFRRRFRMGRNLFLRIVDGVSSQDNYFLQKRDATGKLGLTTLQKITAAHRQLAYGVPTDSVDEYIRIAESTAIECLKRFCRAIVEKFGNEYLRKPTVNDIERLLRKGEERGFPGMLGSLDCMHWSWKNCPTAWAGQYSGRHGSPTIILEAVASYDLWIWHAHFGLPGSNNDVNVLEASNLFADLAKGITPPVKYKILDKEYDVGYYLADGIYPKWSTLVQTISNPQGRKKQHFAMMQEACRKDVERAFGVLQSRFAIVKGPARFWDKRVLQDIMSACIIMHNMIIEDEGELAPSACPPETPNVQILQTSDDQFNNFLARHRQIRSEAGHIALRNALIEHLWAQHGREA